MRTIAPIGIISFLGISFIVLGIYPMHITYLGGVRIPVQLSWGPSFGLGFVVAAPAGVILNRTGTPKHTRIGSSCRGHLLAEQFPMA